MHRHHQSLRVAIVGGGIGGLSAAVALHRIGAQVRVYEQARELGDIGAGVALHQNSQRVLQRLGLCDGIARRGVYLPGFRLLTRDGTVVSHGLNESGARQVALHRADLVAILAAALPSGIVHTGYRCVRFAQHDGSATVSFDNGLSASADVVIAADGIHSSLRHYVVESRNPVFSGMMAYRGLIPARRLRDAPPDLVMWSGDDKRLLAYPVRSGRLINYVGIIPADEEMLESWSAPGNPAALAAAFEDWPPEARRLLALVETTLKWGLYDRDPLPQWTHGRLTLLGDAAHPMLPHLGQGANQAIEDGLALAILLRGVSAAEAPAALLRYEILRREHTAQVQLSSRVNGVHFDSAQPLSPDNSWVRDYDVEKEALALS
jgi:salicylate hydroxylase